MASAPILPKLSAVLLAACMADAAQTQTVQEISGAALVELVSGRTWGLSIYGIPERPSHTNLFDFRKDRSVCARAVGSKHTDKCADQGKWEVKNNVLCWELTWMGAESGLKASCVSVRQVAGNRFELRSEKTPDLVFAVMQVM
ncbi:hypothetical protein LJR130_006978 [Variovorax sp. LjRoot130]|uniref:hypothetical protein n=1 Tax=Variovorax sp. LjRoot130 TaxID=3342261 RepID=UPI003ECE4971